jgi:hypothetical protein
MLLAKSEKRRTAFTLVELLIGAAITVMIMTILAICFQTSMTAMSAMRAQGDAADQLRALGTVMKKDFAASRCLETEGPMRNHGRRISDYDMRFGIVPNNGFFYLESPPSTLEGNDGTFDSFFNFPGGGSVLGARIWMTCVNPGGDDSKVFSANVGGTVVTSEAAEVAYFLQPMAGSSNSAAFGGTSLGLFNLHRRQRLVAIDSARQAVMPNSAPEVISTVLGAPNVVNTMSSLVLPGNRPAFPTRLTGTRTGDDIILSNVLSLEFKPMWQHSSPFRDPVPFGGRAAGGGPAFPSPAYPPNHDAPFDDLTKATADVNSFKFDSLAPAMPIRIQSMQVRIRIYDPKAKTARQMTIIVDL